MTRWLLLLSLFLAPLSSLAVAATVQDKQGFDLDAFLRTARQEEDDTPGILFQQAADVGTEEAFDTLRKAIVPLRKENKLNTAYGAFVRFRGKPALLRMSVDYLYGEARSAKRDENQRAAARALASIGKPAFEELEQLLAKHREEDVRLIVAQPLIGRLGEIGDKKATTTILTYAQLGRGNSEQRIKAALAQCQGSGVNGLPSDALLDPDTPRRWRELLLSVLASREGRDVTKTLVKALDDSSPEVRTVVLDALATRKDRSTLKKARKSLSSKHDGELRQAIVTVGVLSGGDEDWAEEVLEYARDSRFAARMGAAQALLELRTTEAIDALERLLADTDWRVRAQALQQVANLRRKRSIPILIDRLDQESARLKHDVARVLRLTTGLDNGTSANRWRSWWSAEGEGFALPEVKVALDAEKERAARRKENPTTATFYGLEVVSDRVAFVLDTSGSMSAKASTRGRTGTDRGKNAGPTRLEVAKKELSGALRGISPGVLFNIVFFSTGVSPWQDELIAKDEEIQEAAEEFVARQAPAGGTNIYDAILVALEDPRVDTIFLLSDGDPTAGSVTDPEEILSRIAKLNRVRQVQFHCISIGKGSRFLERLAQVGGGKYTEVL